MIKFSIAHHGGGRPELWLIVRLIVRLIVHRLIVHRLRGNVHRLRRRCHVHHLRRVGLSRSRVGRNRVGRSRVGRRLSQNIFNTSESRWVRLRHRLRHHGHFRVRRRHTLTRTLQRRHDRSSRHVLRPGWTHFFVTGWYRQHFAPVLGLQQFRLKTGTARLVCLPGACTVTEDTKLCHTKIEIDGTVSKCIKTATNIATILHTVR